MEASRKDAVRRKKEKKRGEEEEKERKTYYERYYERERGERSSEGTASPVLSLVVMYNGYISHLFF